MKPVLLDSDTISFFFRNEPGVVQEMSNYLREHQTVYVSVITYYEIENGLRFKDAKSQLSRFEEFIEQCNVLKLDKRIARRAAGLHATFRQNGITRGHNDMLIAATAIVHDLRLISNNVKDFIDIDELTVENWVRS